MNRRSSSLRTLHRAFTLIELLLVMVIIAVLAAIVVPRFAGRSEDAQITAADSQIKSHFGVALDTYEIDNGAYPTTAQGMAALRSAPTSPEAKNWKGPYLKSEIPRDPWGSDYVYKSPGTHNKDSYDLSSNGPDKSEGTEDDIVNW